MGLKKHPKTDKPFIAEFDSLGNNLFWKFIIPIFWTKDNKIIPNNAVLKWGGYNDDYWWDNVGNKAAQRTDQIGNVWELNYITNEVELIKRKRGAYL